MEPNLTDRPTQDFRAAMLEVSSNLEVRRLMFVLMNVLVPATVLAGADGWTGSYYPPELAWLPVQLPWLIGAILMVSGLLVCTVLARCHFGMVVNGTKLRVVQTGTLATRPLNWLGVTTNFQLLTALFAGTGALLLGAALSTPIVAFGAAGVVVLLPMLVLAVQHRRANRLAAKLREDWQTGPIDRALEEEHVRRSLDATTADISIVVTMCAALFAGVFGALTNLGSLNPQLALRPSPATLQTTGFAVLASMTALSLLLSARMVVRLRLALAEHSLALAELREEPDDPYRFQVRERSFLLYLVVCTLALSMVLSTLWHLSGAKWAALGTGVLGLGLLLYYPAQLHRGRPR